MKVFGGDLARVALKDGAIDTKTKEFIYIGIAVAIKCEPCIVAHTKNCIAAGITREEFDDALKVSVLMGGGPGVA